MGIRPADIVVGDDGRIAALTDAGKSGAGNPTVDATGLYVLPGLVDAHVHLDEPGRIDWEGFATGTAAALAGGVTTVVDMPIDCDPPTTTAAAVIAKHAAVEAHSVVDVALWGGLVPSSLDHLASMLDAGVVGFKAFACPSGWDEFPAADDATLAAGMAVAARAGVPVAVHCELEHLGRTIESEIAAVRWAAALAQRATVGLHVVHVSSGAAVDEAKRWPSVTVETCPHYLVLDEIEAAAIGPRARCFPPIRSAADREALWQRVRDGSIDVIASDHSPCPPAWRDGPAGWAGIDSIGMTLPLLLTTGKLPLPRIVELTTAAARLLALAGKGEIREGFDADFALLDAAAEWTVAAETQRTRHHASPYTGRRLRGEIVMTVLRGEVMFSRGVVTRERGGRVVRRAN